MRTWSKAEIADGPVRFPAPALGRRVVRLIIVGEQLERTVDVLAEQVALADRTRATVQFALVQIVDPEFRG